VYTPVNNLHITTLYKLHYKLSCACRATRVDRVDKLDTAKMHGPVVSCRDVTS